MSTTARNLAIMALLSATATLAAGVSGSGKTTRYWDCCKPSCAWNDLSTLGIDSPVKTCAIDKSPITDSSLASGCNGGSAYMCADQTPWAVSADLAYGFAAVSSASPNCCQCYQLTFTSTAIAGKKMIVQATNTGNDVSDTQFDLAMPGGGFGEFNGCATQWGATSAVWGANQYGGASTNTCANFPSPLQAGCSFRWDWFQGADNPTVDYEEVACPAALTALSGCVRTGDKPYGPVSTGPAASSSSAVAAPKPSTSSAPVVVVPTTSSAPVVVPQPSSSSAPVVVPQPSSAPAAVTSSSVVVPVASPSSVVASVAASSSSSSVALPVAYTSSAIVTFATSTRPAAASQSAAGECKWVKL